MILPAGDGLFLTDCFCLRGTPTVDQELFVEDVGGGRLLVPPPPTCSMESQAHRVVGYIKGLPEQHAGLLCFKPSTFINRDGVSHLGTEWVGAFLRELCLTPAHWNATRAKEVPRKEPEQPKSTADDTEAKFRASVIEELKRAARRR